MAEKIYNIKTSFQNTITVGMLNVRSIFHKVAELDMLCRKHRLDIFAVNETWLHDEIDDNEVAISGYKILRNDRQTHGGGVGLYIKDGIKFKSREDIHGNHLVESCWIEVSTKNGNVLIGTAYRPPTPNKDYYNKFLDMLNHVTSEGKEVILLGDLNFNYYNDASYRTLSSIETMYDMKQLVTSSTRIYAKANTKGEIYFKESLIDIILSTMPDHHISTNVIKCTLSDHFLIKTKLNIRPYKTHNTVSYRDFSTFKEDDFINDIVNCDDLKKIFRITDTDSAWNIFKSKLSEICNSHAPVKIRRVRSKSCPWMTKDILNLIYKRDLALRKFWTSKNLTDHNNYKSLRNQVTSLIRNTKRQYYENQFRAHNNDPREMWKIINSLLPNKKKESTFNLFTPDQYNKYFCQVGANISDTFKEPYTRYPWKGPKSTYKFNFKEIKLSEVEKLLSELNDFSSLDVTLMDSKLLKIAAKYISQHLTYIFNLSIKQGVVCQDWKVACVTPAYKGKGSKEELSNYRPISNITHIAKVLEKLVNKQFMDYLLHHEFITEAQSAYRPKHSTVTALHKVMEDFLDALNDGCEVGLCFLDTKKCFDSINHHVLLDKLENYGVLKAEHKWFASYLHQRTQKVKVNGTFSKSGYLTTGVPQGSILGPTLFLLFINDLPQHTIKASISIYSDDVLIYYIGNNFQEVKESLQQAMDSVNNWYKMNRLKLSITKCGTMLITNKKHGNKLNIKIDDIEITDFTDFKYLGLIFDNQLKFDMHIHSKISKIRRQVGALRRLAGFVSPDILCNIYKTVIQPSMDYGISVWGACSDGLLELLQKQQYLAARIVFQNFDFVNTNPQDLCDALKWNSLKDRFKFVSCCIIYKSIHGLLPNYLCDQILYEFEVHDYRTRGAINNDLHLPFPKIEKYKSSLFYNGAKEWNSLNNAIRDSHSILSFKRNYKRQYFN